MTSMRSLSFLSTVAVALATLGAAQQQCLQPTAGFHVDGVGNPSTFFMGVAGHDDGNGPALFVAGLSLGHAGADAAIGLARFDGTQWSDTGVPMGIWDMALYDDGNGEVLYVVDAAPTIFTWNGATLVPLADQPNDVVYGFDVVDVGTGPELYVTGRFTQVGSLPAPGLARWNGSTWSALPAGNDVRVPFEAFDSGAGLQLYGVSHGVNGTAHCEPSLVRLDGGSWTSLATFDSATACVAVNDLHVHDFGSGPALYVAGKFATVDGVTMGGLVRWNGATFSAFGNVAGETTQLMTFDDGSGTALYAAMSAFNAPTRWSGSSWQSVGGGLGEPNGQLSTFARVLGTFDDGSGAKLVAAGSFEASDTAPAYGAARWNGATWSGLGSGGQGLGAVPRVEVLDDGSGAKLYAYGALFGAGNVLANHVARWNGSAWTTIGSGLSLAIGGSVSDLETFDDGNGPALYASGFFGVGGNNYGVARFDGAQWLELGNTLPLKVWVLAVHDGQLFAGANSSPYRWTGSTWQMLGSGTNGAVLALADFDGFLYATGEFNIAGGVAASGVARWSSDTGWQNAGIAVDGGTSNMVVHDDGTGAALYLVGNGATKRLQGGVWTLLPPPSGELSSVDLGLGRPSLVACGKSLSGSPLQVWTGTSWVDMTSDVTDKPARSIAALPSGSSCAPDVFVAGDFTKWGGVVSHHVAQLSLCGEPGIAYCFGDGTLSTPCPCTPPNTVPSPSGAPGHGCANSFDLDGAKLCAVGTVDPDTVTLRVSGQTPAGFTQFFKGNVEIPGGFAIFDGVRCVGGTFIRFGAQNAVLGTAFYPNPALGFATPLSAIGGTPVGSGQTGHYQTIYRNVAANFCSAGLLNFSNALRITWN
ncbi:MAG: hypothetical protein ACKVWV_13430 [Planctomycetota bacterium]